MALYVAIFLTMIVITTNPPFTIHISLNIPVTVPVGLTGTKDHIDCKIVTVTVTLSVTSVSILW